MLYRTILEYLRLGVTILCQFLTLLNQSVIMRIITEHSVIVSATEDLCQVVLVIREHKCLKLVCLDLLRCLDQQLKLNIFGLLGYHVLINQLSINEVVLQQIDTL